MDTNQINFYCNSIPSIRKIYGGCWPGDHLHKLRNLRKLPKALVVNTCNIEERDFSKCHWILIVITNQSISILDSSFINSYQLYPHIESFVRKQRKKIFALPLSLQSNYSDRCGYFVCVFLFCVSKGIKINRLMRYFNKTKLYLNDKLVKELFECFFINQSEKCLNKRKK